MPKKKVKRPFTPIFNKEVMEVIVQYKLKSTEWAFLMVLWRLTWGMRNMKVFEKGKVTAWEPQEWINRTGMDKATLSRTKAGLVKKRVINSKTVDGVEMIGYQKNESRWKLIKWSTGSSRSNDQQLLTKQSTTVDQTVNKEEPKASPRQRLDAPKESKEKKKLYNVDFTDFWNLWRKECEYPKRSIKKQAGLAYQKLTSTLKVVTPTDILKGLQDYIKWELPEAQQRAIKTNQFHKNQYVPAAERWLTKRFSDGPPQKRSDSGAGERDKRVLDLEGFIAEAEENYRKWGDIEYKNEIQYWKDKLAYYLKRKGN